MKKKMNEDEKSRNPKWKQDKILMQLLKLVGQINKFCKKRDTKLKKLKNSVSEIDERKMQLLKKTTKSLFT